MRITLELTYDMSKAVGVRRIEVDDATSVADAVARARAYFAEKADEGGAKEFDRLSRIAAVAVNGVLVRHREGPKAKLSPGDRVAFVKAAAGG